MTARGLVSFFHLLKPGSNAPRSIHSLAWRGEAWHLTEILGPALGEFTVLLPTKITCKLTWCRSPQHRSTSAND